MSFRVLLVDEDWVKLGFFDSDTAECRIGREFVDDQGRRFAITATVVNPDPASVVSSTWMVEPS